MHEFTFRVWYKSEEACLLSAVDHDAACVKATYQARAFEKNNFTKRGSDEWVTHTLVVKTENLDLKTSRRWTPSQVTKLIEKRNSDQKAFQDAIQD